MTLDNAMDPAAPAVRLDDSKRTRCEVWTRVAGYHRPLASFNVGKRSEHGARAYFLERPGDLESTI